MEWSIWHVWIEYNPSLRLPLSPDEPSRANRRKKSKNNNNMREKEKTKCRNKFSLLCKITGTGEWASLLPDCALSARARARTYWAWERRRERARDSNRSNFTKRNKQIISLILFGQSLEEIFQINREKKPCEWIFVHVVVVVACRCCYLGAVCARVFACLFVCLTFIE